MDRPIHALIEARAAGDPLTATEIERLNKHEEEALLPMFVTVEREHVVTVTRREPTPNEMRAFNEAHHVESVDFESVRDAVLSDLDAMDVFQLRNLVRRMLYALEVSNEEAAESKGLKRRHQRLRQRGAQQTAIATRLVAESILNTIGAVKVRHQPPLIDKAAARAHLCETDPLWLVGTDTERDRKVDALERRIRRARKRTGHPLSERPQFLC